MIEKEDDFRLTDKFKMVGRGAVGGQVSGAILDAMSWYEKNHGSGLSVGQIFELITQKRIQKNATDNSSRISSTIKNLMNKGLIRKDEARKYYLLKPNA